MTSDAAGLLTRMERLEAVRAVEQLKFLYAERCDDGYDPDGIAALFVEGGVWEVAGRSGRFEGQQSIRAHFARLSRSIVWAQHYVMAPRVEISDDLQSARGTFRLLCLCSVVSEEGGSESNPSILSITYEDRLIRRGADWYITHLVGRTEMSADWGAGWRHPVNTMQGEKE